MVARARCRALLAAATLVPRAEAVSLAGQPSVLGFVERGEHPVAVHDLVGAYRLVSPIHARPCPSEVRHRPVTDAHL
jgi:hypothetical protein